VTTLAAALDVPARRHLEVIRILPRVAWVMAGAAAVVVLGALVADAFAWVRVGLLGRADLTEQDPAEARHAGAVPTVDLGLGDDVRAELGRAASAYRSRAHAVALLLGSVGAARAALGRAFLRGAASLALTAGVIAGHLWAETPVANVEYQAALCDRNPAACYGAALMLLGEAREPAGCPAVPSRLTSADPERAERLLRSACDKGYICSCHVLHEAPVSRAPLPDWFVPRR
jgi:hypothetical protein